MYRDNADVDWGLVPWEKAVPVLESVVSPYYILRALTCWTTSRIAAYRPLETRKNIMI